MQGLGAERFALPKKQGRLGTPRGRAFVVALVVVGLAVAGYLGYQRFIAASAAPPPVQTVQVRRGSLESTVSATGTVAARQASLGFGAAGRVKSIDVAVGQQVQAGQTLATLDTESLQLQLEQARSNERAARLKLQQLQEGATPEEIEAARAALAAAESRARYLAASSDGSDVQAAEAAVSAAEATLAGARARLQQLEAGPDPAEVAQAEQAVAAAQAALEKAEADLAALKAGPSEAEVEAARLGVDRAKQSLLASQISRDATCGRDPEGPSCKSADAQVWAGELAVKQAELELQQLLAGPKPEELAAAERGVESARKNLESAEAQRQKVLAGPTEAELQEARGAVASAEANLQSARQKLEEARAGARASEVQAAQANVASAAATLASKTSPRASDLALAEEEVRRAELAVRQAELTLDGAVLKAPFDGVVAAVEVSEGESVGANAAAITLVDPRAVQIAATVDESDVARLSPGQPVQVVVDALGGQTLQGRVAAVSPLGASQQGVTTYGVTVELEPGDVRLPAGMNVTLTVIVDRKDDVLLVPSRAVRRQGQQQMVLLMVNGKPELRPVRTGLSNDQFVEIVEGVQEGDVLAIPATSGDARAAAFGASTVMVPGGVPGNRPVIIERR